VRVPVVAVLMSAPLPLRVASSVALSASAPRVQARLNCSRTGSPSMVTVNSMSAPSPTVPGPATLMPRAASILFTLICAVAVDTVTPRAVGAETAAAQDRGRGGPEGNWALDLGFGGAYAPDYEGSDDYDPLPLPVLSLRYRDWIGISPDDGLNVTLVDLDRFTASVNVGYDFGRENDEDSAGGSLGGIDNDALIGLDKVDEAVTVGGSVAAYVGFAEAYVSLNQALDGPEGLLIDFGLQTPFPLTADETLFMTLGLSATWASDDYMEAYFGVSDAEVTARNMVRRTRQSLVEYERYEAEAGIKSYGVNASLQWQFRPKWSVEFIAEYSLMAGDAADSPLVELEGDDNQFIVGLAVARRFTW